MEDIAGNARALVKGIRVGYRDEHEKVWIRRCSCPLPMAKGVSCE
jgi:hypothetical protein